jgi:hypothetical protein
VSSGERVRVPENLDDLIVQMLDREPSRRPGSVDESSQP